MPHEGYANPVTNDRPGFHSNVPVSELTERVTRAIEASDIISAPPAVKTTDRVTHKNSNGSLPSPTGLGGLGRPNTSALTHLIPRCAQRLDPRL